MRKVESVWETSSISTLLVTLLDTRILLSSFVRGWSGGWVGGGRRDWEFRLNLPPQGFGFFPTNIVGLLLESFGDFKTLSVLRESAWERARYSVWLSRFLVTKERLVSHLQHVSTLLCCRTLKYTLLAENGINCVASWPCIFSCSVRQKHTTGRIKTPPQMKVAP